MQRLMFKDDETQMQNHIVMLNSCQYLATLEIINHTTARTVIINHVTNK